MGITIDSKRLNYKDNVRAEHVLFWIKFTFPHKDALEKIWQVELEYQSGDSKITAPLKTMVADGETTGEVRLSAVAVPHCHLLFRSGDLATSTGETVYAVPIVIDSGAE